MTAAEYHIEWNGEEYVATCPSVPGVVGMNRHPGWAFSALLDKIRDQGGEIVPAPKRRAKPGDGPKGST